MKTKLLISICAAFLISGCAGTNWQAVGQDLIADVEQGIVTAADAYTAYQALNQGLTSANVSTGKLSPEKVLAAAVAIRGTLQASPGLKTAVYTLVGDANSTIADLNGSPPKAIIAAVSNQGAGTVSTIAALPEESNAAPKTVPFQ